LALPRGSVSEPCATDVGSLAVTLATIGGAGAAVEAIDAILEIGHAIP
jgi:hypothetical protein